MPPVVTVRSQFWNTPPNVNETEGSGDSQRQDGSPGSTGRSHAAAENEQKNQSDVQHAGQHKENQRSSAVAQYRDTGREDLIKSHCAAADQRDAQIVQRRLEGVGRRVSPA